MTPSDSLTNVIDFRESSNCSRIENAQPGEEIKVCVRPEHEPLADPFRCQRDTQPRRRLVHCRNHNGRWQVAVLRMGISAPQARIPTSPTPPVADLTAQPIRGVFAPLRAQVPQQRLRRTSRTPLEMSEEAATRWAEPYTKFVKELPQATGCQRRPPRLCHCQ